MKYFSGILILLVVSLAACGQPPLANPAGIEPAAGTIPAGSPVSSGSPPTAKIPEKIGATPGPIPTGSPLPPYATKTPYDSAPEDGNLDTACRITIDLFFSYKQGFSNEAYRKLFIPASQYLAVNAAPPPEARILLKLEPASQWWQQNYPDQLIPGALLPEEPNEYIYHVEFTTHYEPSTTPVVPFPDGWTIHMISDGPNSCKIKSYGKG